MLFFLFLMLRRPPRFRLFPYTTLFRSTRLRVRGKRSSAFTTAKRDPMSWSSWGHPVCPARSEEHTSELQSHSDLVCRLLLEKKKKLTKLGNDATPFNQI